MDVSEDVGLLDVGLVEVLRDLGGVGSAAARGTFGRPQPDVPRQVADSLVGAETQWRLAIRSVQRSRVNVEGARSCVQEMTRAGGVGERRVVGVAQDLCALSLELVDDARRHLTAADRALDPARLGVIPTADAVAGSADRPWLAAVRLHTVTLSDVIEVHTTVLDQVRHKLLGLGRDVAGIAGRTPPTAAAAPGLRIQTRQPPARSPGPSRAAVDR